MESQISILEIDIFPIHSKLVLTWAMNASELAVFKGILEVRLYLEPFPILGTTNLNVDLPTRQRSRNASLNLSRFTITHGVSWPGFNYGPEGHDSEGRFTRIILDGGLIDVPTDITLARFVAKWEVEALAIKDKSLRYRVVFGYTKSKLTYRYPLKIKRETEFTKLEEASGILDVDRILLDDNRFIPTRQQLSSVLEHNTSSDYFRVSSPYSSSLHILKVTSQGETLSRLEEPMYKGFSDTELARPAQYSPDISVIDANIDCFVGYHNILEAIRKDPSRIICILGLPGSGKTCLLGKLIDEANAGAIFTYTFRDGLVSLEDLLARLVNFLRIPHSVLSLSELTIIEVIIQLINKREVYLFFDRVEAVTESFPKVRGFFELLMAKISSGKILFASRVRLSFVSEADLRNYNVTEYRLEGLDSQDITEYFQCRNLQIPPELPDKLGQTLPKILDLIVPLIESTENINQLLEEIDTSKQALIDDLFDKIYSHLGESEQKILLAIALCLFPIQRTILLEYCSRILNISQAHSVLRTLQKQLLVESFEGTFVTVHEIIRQLVTRYASGVNEVQLHFAEYLYEHGEFLEHSIQVFLWYYQAKKYQQAAEFFSQIHLNVLEFYPDMVELFCQRFEPSMVTKETWGWILGIKGDHAFHVGRYEEAEDAYLEMITIGNEIGQSSLISSANFSLGNIFFRKNNDEKALYYFSEALRIAKTTNEVFMQARAVNNLGLMSIGNGDFEQGKQYLEQGLTLLQEAQVDEFEYKSILGNLAHLYYEQNDIDQADVFANRTLALVRAANDVRGEALALYNLGLHRLKSGNNDAAKDFLTQSHEVAATYKITDIIAMTLNVLVNIDAEEKDFKQALERLLVMQAIYSTEENEPDLTITQLRIAGVYLALDSFKEAGQYIELGLNKLELLDNDRIKVHLENIISAAYLISEPKLILSKLKSTKNRLCKKDLSFALSQIYGALGEIYLNVMASPRLGFACLYKELDILDSLKYLEDQFDRMIDLGQALSYVGSYDEANVIFENAKELAVSENRIDKLALFLIAQANNFALSKDRSSAIQAYTKALDYFENGSWSDAELQSEALLKLAEVKRELEQYDEAIDLLESCIALATKHELTDTHILALQSYGKVYTEQKEFRKGIDVFQRAISLVSDPKLILLNATLHLDLGNLFFAENKYEDAKSHYLVARDLARNATDANLEEGSILSIAYAHYEMGTLDEFVEEFERTLTKAYELEHFENFVQMIQFAVKVNIKDEDSDHESTASMFIAGIFAAISLAEEQNHLSDYERLSDVFAILSSLCHTLEEQAVNGHSERMLKFLHILNRHLREVGLGSIANAFEDIVNYSTKTEQSLWSYFVERWILAIDHTD